MRSGRFVDQDLLELGQGHRRSMQLPSSRTCPATNTRAVFRPHSSRCRSWPCSACLANFPRSAERAPARPYPERAAGAVRSGDTLMQKNRSLRIVPPHRGVEVQAGGAQKAPLEGNLLVLAHRTPGAAPARRSAAWAASPPADRRSGRGKSASAGLGQEAGTARVGEPSFAMWPNSSFSRSGSAMEAQLTVRKGHRGASWHGESHGPRPPCRFRSHRSAAPMRRWSRTRSIISCTLCIATLLPSNS